MSKKENSKELVEKLLTKYPVLRERQDSALILTYLMHKGLLNPNIKYVSDILDIIPQITNLMTLGRNRAVLQNKEGKCLAEYSVRLAREEQEELKRQEFSIN